MRRQDVCGAPLLAVHAFAVGALADATLMRVFCMRAGLVRWRCDRVIVRT
jgi:hypothetical protein